MTWYYEVTTRAFTRNNDKKILFKADYAGAIDFRNNSDYECLKNQGPLPRGRYKISGPIHGHKTAGPYVLRLTPCPCNNMCGRSGFLIHGNNKINDASTGCIILKIYFREKIIKSGDFELVVK